MKLNARAVVRTSPQLAKSRPHQRETRYSLLHLHPQYIEGYWSTPTLPARAPTQHHRHHHLRPTPGERWMDCVTCVDLRPPGPPERARVRAA